MMRAALTLLFVTAASAAHAAQEQMERTVAGQPDVTGSLLKISLGLLVVVVAIFASAWFFKRFTQFSHTANGAMKVVGGLSLGAREKIVLIQVGKEQLLVGVAPGRVQTLHVLPEPLPDATNTEDNGVSFAMRLNTALKQWKSQ